jgi:excisionase family DNA binding protein
MYGKFIRGAESYGDPRKNLLYANLHQLAYRLAASGAWKTADGVKSRVLNARRPRVSLTSTTYYLSVEQVAKRFSVSKDTIWRWKRNGEFPAPVKLGGTATRRVG